MLPPAMQARICEIFSRKGVDTDPDGEEAMMPSNWPDNKRQSIETLFLHVLKGSNHIRGAAYLHGPKQKIKLVI